ncbi:MAG: hypothetical protein WBB19_12495 [Desulforhopalus sp.]
MDEGQRVHIGGIKLSEELAQVTVSCKSSADSSMYQLLRLMAERDINISFFCHSITGSFPESIFCVDRSDLGKVQQILNFTSFQNKHVSIISSVGMVNIFPHRNSLRLLGTVLDLFGRNGFPVHSLCTSISAIALNTDYSLLDKITDTLQHVLELPKNHAPFRQFFRLKQISE